MSKFARSANALLVSMTVALVATFGSSSLPPTSHPAPVQLAVAESAHVCDNQAAGPVVPPPGAVVVDPTVDGDVGYKTYASPPGTTFWLAPGIHTLTMSVYGQIIPKDGDVYLGAPGAVLDGRGVNLYAFTMLATNVTIRYLTVQGFIAGRDEGVVNASSGDGWVIEHNTIQNNKGAGMMVGGHQQIRYNCLRNNGQYGINGYKYGDGITGLVVENNEISGNNTDDWEVRSPGCGCTGGAKFWAVNGADLRSNWVHDNHGPGLWADTNDNDFLIENNLIEKNDSVAIFYEISYNLVVRGNIIRNNTWVQGKQFSDRGDNFPLPAIYLSEAGGDARVPARTSKIEIYNNLLENNWSGITAWEDANRFCNSPGNTSSSYCTKVVAAVATCAQPGIAAAPLYDDCRWKTQQLDVHDNTFSFDPAVVGCRTGLCGRMAVISNYGTYPDWSPYKGTVVQDAITLRQGNVWRNNSYIGPWAFMPFDTSHLIDTAQWQADPYRQDAGSTFTPIGGQPVTVSDTFDGPLYSNPDGARWAMAIPGAYGAGVAHDGAGNLLLQTPSTGVTPAQGVFLFETAANVARLGAVDLLGDVTFPIGSAGGSMVAIARATGIAVAPAGYYLRLDVGAGAWRVYYYDGAAETPIGAAQPLSFAAGTRYAYRLQCQGTTVRARVWVSGQAEPATWPISATDTRRASGFAGIGRLPGTSPAFWQALVDGVVIFGTAAP